MRIRYHVAVDNRLQRSVVEFNVTGTHLGRRIVHFVRQQDGSPMPDLERALWQERIHSGDWHNVVDDVRARALERDFIAQVIDQKNDPAPMQDSAGAWRHDQKDILAPLTTV